MIPASSLLDDWTTPPSLVCCDRPAPLIFPSLYEGFGIPPLEAFAQGCPVLASNIPAVHEVCGPAALYFAPHDDAALAALMMASLDLPADPQWRAIARQRVAAYSWDASAAVLDALVRTSR